MPITFPIAVLAIIVWTMVTTTSCGNTKHLQYLQGSFDTSKLSRIKYPELVIQQGDLIGITVYSDNPLASAYYNLPTTTNINTTSTGITMEAAPGFQGATYLVDNEGNIQFPGIGSLNVVGLTKVQLYQQLTSKLKDKLQNPYFNIRLTNYRITLIGEINRPGQFNVSNEKISLLEALGLGGDLTIYGRRDNILVIREINGIRTFGRLNLLEPDIMTSPYFYLQPNDVVYVDISRQKAASSDQVTIRNISLATSIISVLAILAGVFR